MENVEEANEHCLPDLTRWAREPSDIHRPSRWAGIVFFQQRSGDAYATFRFCVVRKPPFPRWKVLLQSGLASLRVSAFLAANYILQLTRWDGQQ